MSRTPEVLFGLTAGSKQCISRFEGFVSEVAAHNAGDVVPALAQIESAVQNGLYAAGFLSYEAATSLDPPLPTVEMTGFPLVWFGLYRELRSIPLREWWRQDHQGFNQAFEWHPTISREEYLSAVEKIRDYIAAGDIYQVNFTLRGRCRFSGDASAFFRDLCRSQPTPYSAFIDLDGHSILSASPELFFQLDNGVLTVRPMKGTARRGRWRTEDVEIAAMLRENDKERAENLMIVDLLRNDLGRVSENGSVTVNSLFDVEALGTVHQMTSTISSRLRPDVGLTELFRSLFPCGSITGAPKKRSMEIIAELEGSPRGLYTGCIGYLSPGMRKAVFSVAIRTVVIDKDSGTGELGVGSGITWYSAPDAEYHECLSKGLFVRNIPPEFKLLESLLLETETGYFLLERHLERLCDSARYFGFPIDAASVRATLEKLAHGVKGGSKARLMLSSDGSVATEIEPLRDTGNPTGPYIAFATTPVDSANPFLYHKTSNREVYRCELEKRPDCTDVIFVNERGEVTEGAVSNVVIRNAGLLLTPPVTSGLLPGTFRAELLENGEIGEQVLMPSDLEQADAIYLINSVRRWRRVRLVDGAVPCAKSYSLSER